MHDLTARVDNDETKVQISACRACVDPSLSVLLTTQVTGSSIHIFAMVKDCGDGPNKDRLRQWLGSLERSRAS